jgi:hypothetical protein
MGKRAAERRRLTRPGPIERPGGATLRARYSAHQEPGSRDLLQGASSDRPCALSEDSSAPSQHTSRLCRFGQGILETMRLSASAFGRAPGPDRNNLAPGSVAALRCSRRSVRFVASRRSKIMGLPARAPNHGASSLPMLARLTDGSSPGPWAPEPPGPLEFLPPGMRGLPTLQHGQAQTRDAHRRSLARQWNADPGDQGMVGPDEAWLRARSSLCR